MNYFSRLTWYWSPAAPLSTGDSTRLNVIFCRYSRKRDCCLRIRRLYIQPPIRMNFAQYVLILLIRFYRLALSPLKNALFGPGGSCRFTPSCSEFTLDALRTHGAFHGTWLGLRRLLRCHLIVIPQIQNLQVQNRNFAAQLVAYIRYRNLLILAWILAS